MGANYNAKLTYLLKNRHKQQCKKYTVHWYHWKNYMFCHLKCPPQVWLKILIIFLKFRLYQLIWNRWHCYGYPNWKIINFTTFPSRQCFKIIWMMSNHFIHKLSKIQSLTYVMLKSTFKRIIKFNTHLCNSLSDSLM